MLHYFEYAVQKSVAHFLCGGGGGELTVVTFDQKNEKLHNTHEFFLFLLTNKNIFSQNCRYHTDKKT